MIDVGGPTLLKAAVKNFDSVTTISSPRDYALLVNSIKRNSGTTDLSFRKNGLLRLSKKFQSMIKIFIIGSSTIKIIKISN